MKDRLTQLLFEAEGQVNNDLPLLEQIAEYLIEHGVIVPPCKVGDDVWWISPFDDEVKCEKNGIQAIVYCGHDQFKVITKGEKEPEDIYTDWCNLSEKEACKRFAERSKQ